MSYKHLNSIGKFTAYILYFGVVVFILLELVLRVFDPFGYRQDRYSVILPRNRKMIFENNKIPVLEKNIKHSSAREQE